MVYKYSYCCYYCTLIFKIKDQKYHKLKWQLVDYHVMGTKVEKMQKMVSWTRKRNGSPRCELVLNTLYCGSYNQNQSNLLYVFLVFIYSIYLYQFPLLC